MDLIIKLNDGTEVFSNMEGELYVEVERTVAMDSSGGTIDAPVHTDILDYEEELTCGYSEEEFNTYMETPAGQDEFPEYCQQCKTMHPWSEAQAHWHQPGLCTSCEAQGIADDQQELIRGNC